jgi:hypothetical protein
MPPKWFRRGKNCFIAASSAGNATRGYRWPTPAGEIFIDLLQSFIRILAGSRPPPALAPVSDRRFLARPTAMRERQGASDVFVKI